jgi:hypothetical protein
MFFALHPGSITAARWTINPSRSVTKQHASEEKMAALDNEQHSEKNKRPSPPDSRVRQTYRFRRARNPMKGDPFMKAPATSDTPR